MDGTSIVITYLHQTRIACALYVSTNFKYVYIVSAELVVIFFGGRGGGEIL